MVGDIMTASELQEIGKRISKRRRQIGLTQELLAEKMNVSVQMISNLERGNKAIKIENLIKVSDILDVSTDYILKGSSAGDKNDLGGKIGLLSDCDREMIKIIVDYCLSKE